jgi:hypothetical protein
MLIEPKHQADCELFQNAGNCRTGQLSELSRARWQLSHKVGILSADLLAPRANGPPSISSVESAGPKSGHLFGNHKRVRKRFQSIETLCKNASRAMKGAGAIDTDSLQNRSQNGDRHRRSQLKERIIALEYANPHRVQAETRCRVMKPHRSISHCVTWVSIATRDFWWRPIARGSSHFQQLCI